MKSDHSHKAMVDEDACFTIQEMAEALDISSGSVPDIFKDKLCNSKASAGWIPHILMQKKRGIRLQTQNLFSKSVTIVTQCIAMKPILHGDATQVHYYEFERKAWDRAWAPKGGNPPEIAKRN